MLQVVKCLSSTHLVKNGFPSPTFLVILMSFGPIKVSNISCYPHVFWAHKGVVFTVQYSLRPQMFVAL
jgi:hypothetical protein